MLKFSFDIFIRRFSTKLKLKPNQIVNIEFFLIHVTCSSMDFSTSDIYDGLWAIFSDFEKCLRRVKAFWVWRGGGGDNPKRSFPERRAHKKSEQEVFLRLFLEIFCLVFLPKKISLIFLLKNLVLFLLWEI